MIDINDLQPNSHKYKAENQNKPGTEKKVEKVINGTVKVRKKTEARKFADIFISEDVSNVKEYIFMDVLVPGIKKAISDIVVNSVEMLLYGETGRSDRRRTSADRVSYKSYYDDRSDRRRPSEDRGRSRYNYDEVLIPSRGEAERVLTCMEELIEEYGRVAVADFYDLVGITCEHTDYNYGWYNVRNASVVRVRDGYIIKFPKVTPLRN